MIADRQTFPLRDLKPNVIAVVHDFVEGTRNRIRFAELGLLPGREIQVAILDKKILGAIELKPKRKFYDYEAKYNPKAKTEHIIPVKISKKNYNKVTSLALKAHKLLKCRGVTRSDFRFYKDKFYLLEINTQPGMTSLSLVPEIANYKGINFIQLIEKIIKDASINK